MSIFSDVAKFVEKTVIKSAVKQGGGDASTASSVADAFVSAPSVTTVNDKFSKGVEGLGAAAGLLIPGVGLANAAVFGGAISTAAVVKGAAGVGGVVKAIGNPGASNGLPAVVMPSTNDTPNTPPAVFSNPAPVVSVVESVKPTTTQPMGSILGGIIGNLTGSPTVGTIASQLIGGLAGNSIAPQQAAAAATNAFVSPTTSQQALAANQTPAAAAAFGVTIGGSAGVTNSGTTSTDTNTILKWVGIAVGAIGVIVTILALVFRRKR
jgi:hypothetical protein